MRIEPDYYIKPDDRGDSGSWVRQHDPVIMPDGIIDRFLVRVGLRRPIKIQWFGAENSDEQK